MHAGFNIAGEACLIYICEHLPDNGRRGMAWTAPTLVEICIGLEINGYLPAEF
jgi:coenzyme PQQ precursor peptide PqqA